MIRDEISRRGFLGWAALGAAALIGPRWLRAAGDRKPNIVFVLCDDLAQGDLGCYGPKREYFYWELHEQQRAIQAVRFGDWKAVRNRPSASIEVYDLKIDSGETTDLAGQKPDLVARAEALMKTARTDDSNWPLRDRPAGKPQQKKQKNKKSKAGAS